MFESITSLSDLNRERKRLVREGMPIPQVNSAYNQAKRKLREEVNKFRKIASYRENYEDEISFYNILGVQKGAPAVNEIHLTSGGILI